MDHDELVKLATNAFGGLSSAGASVEELITADPAHFTGSDVRIRDDDMPTVSFCVAFKGASWKSPDAVPLMVMQAMLGAWDKSAAAGAGHAGVGPGAGPAQPTSSRTATWRSTRTTRTPGCSACT